MDSFFFFAMKIQATQIVSGRWCPYLKGGDAARSSGTGVGFTQSLLAGHLVSVVCRCLHRFVGGFGLTARKIYEIQKLQK